MKQIGLDGVFDGEGNVTVRRIEVGGAWQPVEQGRQWVDDEGRHVLVMLEGRRVQELLLDRVELKWHLKKRRHPRATV